MSLSRLQTTLKAGLLATALLAPSLSLAAGDAEAGKTVFKQNCVICHGNAGKGDGQAAGALNPKPKNFTDQKAMAKITDAMRVKAVTEGGASVGASPVMPAFGQILTPKQIEDVLAYVHTLMKH